MRRLLSLCCAMALLSACAKVTSAPASGGRHPYTIPHTLRFGWQEDVKGLNPHLVNNVIVSYLSDLTMAWLIRGGPDGRPEPELATAFPSKSNGGISADGKTITYHLRKDARWSDGAPFTAADVVFSTQAVLNPANNEQSRYGFDVIQSVRAPDSSTVVIRLKRPYVSFLYQYFNSDGVMCLLPSHLLAKLHDINTAAYNALPVGIGPFKYARWVRGDRVEMVADNLYFRGRPKLDRVIYKIIPDRSVVTTQVRTHEIDLYPLLDPRDYLLLKDAPGVGTLQRPSFRAEWLALNSWSGPFREEAVRRAFRSAIDRPAIVRTVYAGLASLSENFYPPAHPLYTPLPAVPHDVSQAAAILDSAGWKPGPDGVRQKAGRRLDVQVVTVTGAPAVDQILERIRADVRPAGFSLSIKHYPASLVFGPGGKLPRGDFDTSLAAQTLDFLGDISDDFACDQRPPVGYNFGRLCDPNIDRLFTEFNAAYGEPARRLLAAAYVKQLVRHVDFISTGSQFQLFAYNSDLKNYKPSPVSPFDNMMDVDI